MQISRETSHRLTAILCTLVAVAILAAGVTAQHEAASPSGKLEQLESDLRFQVQSAFRMRPRDANKRLELIDTVLGEFRAKARTQEDRQRIASWLVEATRRSMPGLISPLPAVPEYSTVAPPASPSEPVVVQKPKPPVLDQPKPKEQSVVSRKPTDRVEKSIPKPTTIPLVVETTPSEAEPVAIQPAKTTQLVNSTELPASTPAVRQTVMLNLNELSARIAGYHLALDEMDAEIYESQLPNESEIGQFIDQLASVLEDYQFVKLYYESLDAQERRRVAEPRSMQRLVEGIRRRVQKLQRAIETDFLGEFDRSDAERVEQFHAQLDAIAERISW